MVALAIAVTVADDSAPLVWVALWVGLYWLWKFWELRRGKGVATPAVATPANEPAATVPQEPEPQSLPDNVMRRPLWRRILRKTILLGAGAVVLIAVMIGVMILSLSYYARQARVERDKIQKGMTVDEVLPLVHGACGIRTHAVLPENMPDEEGVHYVSLVESKDGTFRWSSGPDYQSRHLTEEAENVRRLRLALAIHLPQRHPTALLFYRNLRG
jgi:hypothetical protein